MCISYTQCTVRLCQLHSQTLKPSFLRPPHTGAQPGRRASSEWTQCQLGSDSFYSNRASEPKHSSELQFERVAPACNWRLFRVAGPGCGTVEAPPLGPGAVWPKAETPVDVASREQCSTF
eukprot:COSAG06_NODE_235_length_19514_cov_33.329333_8_plen_120_part_00